MRNCATTHRKTKMNPRIRVDQANPRRGNRRCSINGKMIPPTEPPVAASPVALPRFTRKKCPIAETAGVKMKDVPNPPRTPNTSTN